jgi:hypothetical protein
MITTRLLVGQAWRRRWRLPLLVAVVAGLGAAVVGASVQATSRADTSYARFTRMHRIYDVSVQGCPPEVNPDEIHDQADLMRLCINPRNVEQFRKVLDRVPGVERTTVTATMVVGLLDRHASNGWGRLSLVDGIVSPHEAAKGRPIIVAGRLPSAEAPDEIALGETASRLAGLGVGDVVRMAGWRQSDLDVAVDGALPPTTPVFESKVVGVIRDASEVASNDRGTLSDATLPGNVIAGSGWMAAHASELSGYGSGVLVRLTRGPAGVDAFDHAADSMPEGWFTNVSSVDDVNGTTIERIIDVERHAVLLFASIAAVTLIGFVLLVGIRVIRRDAVQDRQLVALGMTHRDLRVASLARGMTIGAIAALVAVVGTYALSPLGPVGVARSLEYHLGPRIDVGVLVMVALGMLILFGLAGLFTPVAKEIAPRPVPVARPRFASALGSAGVVAILGGAMTRRRSSRAVIAALAIAMTAAVGAGALVASFDRLDRTPARYGAWWDVAVGQYSEQAPYDAGVARLRANHAVVGAAAVDSQNDIATIDGHNEPFLSSTDLIGHDAPVIASGRAPATNNEVAIGRATARQLGRGIGDELTVVSNNDSRLRVRVVGIAIVNDPINDTDTAGQGVYLLRPALEKIAGPGIVPQSIVVRLDPRLDRATAIESVRRDFPGSIREAAPQGDVINLARLRAVPWLIAGFVMTLALVGLVSSLIALVQTERPRLAIAGAIGLTKRQRRQVYTGASAALAAVGVVIGIPFGVLLGHRAWEALSNGIDIPTGSVVDWLPVIITTVSLFTVTACVAQLADRRLLRATPAGQLRSE